MTTVLHFGRGGQLRANSCSCCCPMRKNQQTLCHVRGKTLLGPWSGGRLESGRKKARTEAPAGAIEGSPRHQPWEKKASRRPLTPLPGLAAGVLSLPTADAVSYLLPPLPGLPPGRP